MAADDLSVDTLSLEDFRLTLQARLDEAHAALTALTPVRSPVPGAAALGDFLDARQTAERHARLCDQFVGRIRRLIDALAMAQAAAAGIADRFVTAENLHTARAHEIADRLRGVTESLDGGRTRAR